MGKLIYRETPTGYREHMIEFNIPSDDWKYISIGEYIHKRENMGLPALEFKKCFVCGRYLQMHRKPIIIYVGGIGIRFICSICYHENNGGHGSEETVL